MDLWQFWSRRWLRTFPPYLVALGLAWVAVFHYRSEPFDWSYLLFLQNYYAAMPFLVSWSLCIEEHFYLFLLLLFFILMQRGKGRMGAALSVMLVMPLLFRLIIGGQATSSFGYYVTASHLNADGLLLGFGVAYLLYFKGGGITPKVRWWSFFAFLLVLSGLFVEVSAYMDYVFGRFLVAILFVSLSLLAVETDFSQRLVPRPVSFIALTSYSIYLSHALVIHGMGALFHNLGRDHPRFFFDPLEQRRHFYRLGVLPHL